MFIGCLVRIVTKSKLSIKIMVLTSNISKQLTKLAQQTFMQYSVLRDNHENMRFNVNINVVLHLQLCSYNTVAVTSCSGTTRSLHKLASQLDSKETLCLTSLHLSFDLCLELHARGTQFTVLDRNMYEESIFNNTRFLVQLIQPSVRIKAGLSARDF